jgi:dTDP-glucose 4,6-dehydratase
MSIGAALTGKQKFLILGSNSFSGATFCDFLAERGVEVIATSRSEESHEAFLPYKWHKRAAMVRFKRIDLNSDLGALDVILKTERPTHVVNFAAQSMVAESWLNPDHWMMTNVVSTVRLHERLRRYDGLERYVHVTTPEVYGSTKGWIREDAPFNPSTPYAVSRAAADMSLKTYFVTHNFPALFTRAANVYGPGQQLYRIIPRTIVAAMGGQKLRLDGGGESVRGFIHMSDVSDATLRVATRGTLGDSYHISGCELVSIRTLVETILLRLGKRFGDCVEIGPERPGKDTSYMLDSFKIRTELGWRDSTSFEQGIDDVIRWAERFKSVLSTLPAKYEHKP